MTPACNIRQCSAQLRHPRLPTKPEHGQSALLPHMSVTWSEQRRKTLYLTSNRLSVYAETCGLQQQAAGALPAVLGLVHNFAAWGRVMCTTFRSAPYIEYDPSLLLQVRKLCEACRRISFVTFVSKEKSRKKSGSYSLAAFGTLS